MTQLSGFHDVRFPAAVSFGASGGPERRIEIVSLASGAEKRNLRQAHALRSYDAGTGLRALADIETVLAFFEARRGPFHAFRFRDPFDWKSCPVSAVVSASDQMLGIGDGARRTFGFTKTYGAGTEAYVRPISLAVAATIAVSVGGVVAPASQYEVTGWGSGIRFKPGFVPAAGQAVRAGFEFDVPVRFDTAQLTLSLTGFKAGQAQSVPLREVLMEPVLEVLP